MARHNGPLTRLLNNALAIMKISCPVHDAATSPFCYATVALCEGGAEGVENDAGS